MDGSWTNQEEEAFHFNSISDAVLAAKMIDQHLDLVVIIPNHPAMEIPISDF
jgi:hypothetical protein